MEIEILLRIEMKLDNLLERMEKLENEIIEIRDSNVRMDDHIDNIMSIYSGYKRPLDYLSKKFNYLIGGGELEN